jgi:membrane protease YdiL (CAAX protease family)
MIGLIVILCVSWLLLYFIEQRNLSALGFKNGLRHPLSLIICFLFAAALCVVFQLFEGHIRNGTWVLTNDLNFIKLVKAVWWDLKSVLFEEFLFRGALLFILIKRLGWKTGVILSAVAFGVYHWFSYGVLGIPVAMLIVFTGTGLMGFAWGWAFAKTESILFPVVLHLGWNFCYNSIFSKGPLGEIGFVLKTTEQVETTQVLLTLIGMILIPVLMVLFVWRFLKPKRQEFNFN